MVFFGYLLFFMSFSLLAKASVPPSLTPWIPWVLKDHQQLTCPFISQSDYAKKNNHICAWPSALTLDVQPSSAVFSQSWQVLVKSIVVLPGDQHHWPLSVTANDQAVVVFTHRGRPAIELGKGQYQIKGQFEWIKPPQNIAISPQTALVNMTINTQSIAFPKIENNNLWLQELAPAQRSQDAVNVAVVRRFSDGEYIKLETLVVLNVSGKMREVKLGKVLPAGFELMVIDSKLAAFVDGEGLLHAKLKPGTWQLLIHAYAQPTLLTWQRPALSYDWPKQEIWLFKAHESLRLGKLSGAKMVDNAQAIMPDHWRELPSYLVDAGEGLDYQIAHRGKPLHLENQLSLERMLWLSFDQRILTFNDNIIGSMIDDWRLRLQSPYRLESGEDQDGSVLVTTDSEGLRGIENRYANVDIQARGVINNSRTLPVTGWQNNFEEVSIILNLPPGNKLFAVFGADSVSSSWWSNWTIWSSFIVLLSAMIATRLVGVSVGVTTALMLLFIFQEVGAPVMAMINLLVAVAIKKHQPFKQIDSLVKGYWLVSVMVALAAILFFCATQMRSVIHPQLESTDQVYNNFRLHAPGELKELSATSSDATPRKLRSEYDSVRYKSKTLERYPSDALAQAGSGIPTWQWNSYRINWHSPVAQDQAFELIVMSKNVYRVLKIAGILLSLLWLFLLLKDIKRPTLSHNQSKAVVSLLALIVLAPGYSSHSQASDLPSQQLLDQLEQRLLAAPSCAPNCVTINQMVIAAQARSLSVVLSVHANVDGVIALPRAQFWRPTQVWNNQQKVNRLIDRKGWIYLPVDQGISQIRLLGQIANVDGFQLEFKQRPKHVELLASQDWQVIGTQGHRIKGKRLEFLATVKQHSGQDKASTRYATRPLVKVSRIVSIDQTWTVQTTVHRIKPSSGAIHTKIATLEGEHITSADILVENSLVEVTLPAGVDTFSWRSTIEQQPTLSLQAAVDSPVIEHWQAVISPSWHASFSGLPVILGHGDQKDYFSYSFYPYPGEQLAINITRPDAVKGQVLAIDTVNLTIEQGTRTSTLSLVFDYRSTRGGEHVIELPQTYQLKEITANGKLINLQLEQGKLAIPILPGKHKVSISMRAQAATPWLLAAPKINLNAPVSNITTAIQLSEQRWILWAQGPLLGPAVLYWGELLVFILLALLLGRVKFSPLSTLGWIILGLGLSLNNWMILMLIVLWFGALSASKYRSNDMPRNAFNVSQLLLFFLSLVALIALIGVVPFSLLSTPSMGIEGNQSGDNYLRWFLDKSEGQLPDVAVVTISTLFYKGMMLIWVIWLSFSCVNWIKWAWGLLGAQGFWRSKVKQTLVEK